MADTIDGRHAPDVARYPTVTMGWLRNEVGQDGLPPHTPVDQSARAAADIRLKIQQLGLPRHLPPCQPLERRVTFFLAMHEEVSFLGPILLVSAGDCGRPVDCGLQSQWRL